MSRERITLLILYILVWVLVVASFASCRTAKDNRAVNRVLTNPELKERVGREWEKANPCTIDTVFVPGDTLIEVDTIIKGGRIIAEPGIKIDKVGDDYIVSLSEKGTVTPGKTIILPGKEVVVTKTIRDTVWQTDLRRLNIALDSVNHWKGLFQQRDAQVKEFTHDKKNIGKIFGWLFGALVRKWWFWLIIVFLAGYLTRNLWGPRIPKITITKQNKTKDGT